MKKVPSFLKQYFWDVNFETLDPQKYPEYLIERLLELGDTRAIRWVFKNFKKETIVHTIKTRRGFSPKTANFWCLVLGIDRKDVVCLQTHYLKMRQTHWPY